MTAQDLLKKQIDETTFMLSKVFEGVTEETSTFKHANLMTPKETVAHLCECYVVLEKDTRGEKHEWGTYAPRDNSWSGLMSEYEERRSKAVEGVYARGDDEILLRANDMMIMHDHYHIGQMCAVRFAIDPEWPPYSIYP
jgi:hypothetical protein